MKKILISSVLSASLLCVANAQSSGLFVGVNAGVPITTPSYSNFVGITPDMFPTSGFGWGVGLDVGYKQAFSQSSGLKYYLSYFYSQSKGSKDNGIMGKMEADINQHSITANVDYWLNFTQAFGAYIGIGVGYQQFDPTWKMGPVSIAPGSKGGLAVPVNIGLTYNFNDKNQILLGAKIPVLAYDYKNEGQYGGTATLRTYIVQIGYNLTF